MGLSKDLQIGSEKAQIIKEKNDKFDFIKIKIFSYLKVTVKKIKSPATEWEEIFGKKKI